MKKIIDLPLAELQKSELPDVIDFEEPDIIEILSKDIFYAEHTSNGLIEEKVVHKMTWSNYRAGIFIKRQS